MAEDQPADYTGRDEYGMPLDGRGRHLSAMEKHAEQQDLFGYFQGAPALDQVADGRLVELPSGSKYVEPITIRELFPEERLSRQALKKAKT